MTERDSPVKISIVTPVHNTDLELFRNTIRSVSEISFDKRDIEWVVVFHNCEEGYIPAAVKELSGCSVEVSDHVLRDNNHTPSAPRNYGISKAVGEYIYFLDSDDILETHFLKKAYETAIEHESQIVIAGATAKSVSKNVMPLPMPLLVYSKNGAFDIDNEKYLCSDAGKKSRKNREILGRLIYGAPMFLGTKLIKRSLIIESGFSFDVDLEFLEDVLFESGLYGAAGRITVLTDETAYTYIQNEGSTFQSIVSSEKASSEMLMEPVKRIISRCEEEDIDYNLFLWSIFEMYGSAFLRNLIPSKVKTRLKEEMAGYVKRLKPIPYVGSLGAKELVSMKFLSDIFVDKNHRVYEQDRVDVSFQKMVSGINDFTGTAIVSKDGSVSYEELNECSDKLAGYIRKRAKDSGAVVGIYMDNSIDRLLALIAVLKAGNPFVVLSKQNSNERISYITDVVKTSLILTDEDYIDDKALFMPGTVFLNYEEVMEAETLLPEKISIKDDVPLVTEFTSGSEGNPKGVTFTRRNFINLLYHFEGNVKNCHQASVSNTYIIHMEIDFLFGLLVSLEALLFGKKLCLLKNPKDINAGFVRNCLALDEGVSMSVVPSVADEWFSDDALNGLFKNVKLLVYGGEGIKKEQLERAEKALAPGTKIYSGYATTETGPAVYGLVTKDHITCGIPQADVCVTIIDESGNPAPCGESGRVCIKGYRVAKGYINGSNEDFEEDRTGINAFISRDEGYITEAGELVICGRLDRMIKSKGVRIDPSEIEKAVIGFEIIENVAVKDFDKIGICCFYTSKTEVDEFELRSYLAERLPYFMMPNAFIRIEQMPVTERGKLDLKSLKLPEGYMSRTLQSEETLEKSGTLVAVLSAFQDAFDHTDIGQNDNFFYLGGDSIKAVELSLSLSDAGFAVSMQDVFAYPTPALLAKAIDEKGADKQLVSTDELEFSDGYVNDTDNKEYDAPPMEGAVYCFEVRGITRGYFTMPMQYREAYRYVLRIQYTTAEALDGDTLKQRVSDVVKRHPALRTDFEIKKDGRVFGIVNGEKDIDVTYRDISRYPENTKDSFIEGFWHAMDMEDELFEVACFKISDTRHEVLVRMTHMVTDALGSSIILKELSSSFDPGYAEDSFIPDKKKTRRRFLNDKDRARDFFNAYLKDAAPASVNPPFGIVGDGTKVLRRFVRISSGKLEELRGRCALLGMAFENYIQYEYGKALCNTLNEDRVIFLCTFAGRDAGNMRTVGNFFTILPVVYDRNMSAQDFSANMLKLGEYSFLDADMVGKLVGIPFSALGTAEGINSNLLDSALTDENVTDAKQIIFGDLRGKRMYIEGDDIVIEMSYYDYGNTDRIYRTIESEMKRSLGVL